MKTAPLKSSTEAQAEMKQTNDIGWGLGPAIRLQLRVLIYCASLLEQLVAQKSKRAKRKPSAYQKFVGQRMKAGLSIQEAVAEWKDKKR